MHNLGEIEDRVLSKYDFFEFKCEANNNDKQINCEENTHTPI